MKIRLIDSGSDSPYMNMAIDEALLSSQFPVLRFYQWDPLALSIGRFQRFTNIDLDFCEQNNIIIIRRLTGGKAVLHDDELTYSFIIDQNLMSKDIIESYNVISDPLIYALKRLGLTPAKNEKKIDEKDNPNCFLQPSFNEILIDNKKIVGSAQVRTEGKVLQHGSIIINSNPNLDNCFKPKINSSNRITSLHEHTSFELNSLKQYLTEGFSKSFKANIITSQLTPEELQKAQDLAKNKYQSKEWLYYNV